MVDKEEFAATHTTPDPIAINSYMRKMVDAKCKYCFMEVSSHGLVQERVAGLDFCRSCFHQYHPRSFGLPRHVQ